MSVSDADRLKTVDALRGLASLGVCWFHLTNGNPSFLNDGMLKSSGRFGWLGVEVFFVISGFVIPYSLWRSGYTPGRFFSFLLKRLVRIEPPYLVSIVVVLVLAYISAALPGFRGAPLDYSPVSVLLHFGYINALVGYPWLNPVYWTLAIEFQFYVLVGLAFRLLVKRRMLAVAFAVSVAGQALSTSDGLIFHWLLLFCLGAAVFQHKAKLIGHQEFLAYAGAIAAAAAWFLGAPIAGVSLATALTIAFVRIENVWLSRLGLISYSLYLLHVPIGGRVINLGARADHLADVWWKILFLAGALAASILAAWAFFLLVERPSRRWSSRISYGSGNGRHR